MDKQHAHVPGQLREFDVFTFVMFTVAAALMLLAMLFLWFTRRQTASHRDIVRRGVQTQAIVVEMRSYVPGTTPNDAMESYFPVVRFETRAGVVEAEVLIGSRPAPARVGQQVAVRYDPDNPRRVLLAQGGLASPGAYSCFSIALSVGFIAFAVLVLLFWYVLKVLLNFPG